MADSLSDTQLAHEKLDVYQCALHFLGLANSVIDQLPSGSKVIIDQLDRAALSIVLNIAEGVGKRSSADKHKFFASARGSAMECGGIFDVLKIQRKLTEDVYLQAKRLLVRIVQMLTKM